MKIMHENRYSNGSNLPFVLFRRTNWMFFLTNFDSSSWYQKWVESSLRFSSQILYREKANHMKNHYKLCKARTKEKCQISSCSTEEMYSYIHIIKKESSWWHIYDHSFRLWLIISHKSVFSPLEKGRLSVHDKQWIWSMSQFCSSLREYSKYEKITHTCL